MTYSFKTRLFTLSLLSENMKVVLNSSQSHKIINVLRLKTGDFINLFNNRDGEWNGKLEIIKNSVNFICNKMVRAPKEELGPTLIFSPLKNIRNDWLIEKATECGVSKFFPTLMDRTVVKKYNKERSINRIISACEQTGRLSLPEVLEMRNFREQIDLCIKNNRVLLFCDELTTKPKIIEVVNKIDRKNLAILIGPEGGFEDKERDYIQSLNNIVVCSLGPRVYRAETAAIIALSIFQ